jgi:hypothetical protein
MSYIEWGSCYHIGIPDDFLRFGVPQREAVSYFYIKCGMTWPGFELTTSQFGGEHKLLGQPDIILMQIHSVHSIFDFDVKCLRISLFEN